MDKMILLKDDLSKFITELLKKNKVFAPIQSDDTILFDQITRPSEMNLDFCKSEIPPKNLLFHQTETLFKFTPGTKAKIESVDVDEKKVIFGIRPCDAKSIAILDHAFKGDYEDPYFLSRRDNTALVGLSCNKPEINCFCTSFDDSPASSKYVDILLTDIGDKYYVEMNNEKGKQLTEGMSNLFKHAKESDAKKKKEVEKKAVDMISRHQKTNGIVEKLDKIFENPFWKEVAFKCVGCGTCTYLCPTCHCFDIQDESTLTKGARVRVWDTCMNPEYTLQASGYNPRPARTNRVKNRIYHKYNYYPKNFDVIACVGCGRCIDLCPVNIDIIDVVTRAGEVKA
ncbi:MAG: 4Fe-4S dicluster domain-containing protein [Thermoplasmatales archaeon]|nr:MAG: 4Fe-4S dicluster domain-containing protein [Thermoplasmatales archaeon]